MKRSYLKRKTPLRRGKKKINLVSSRQDLINECKALLLKILLLNRGGWCEICGLSLGKLGLFHILPISRYPRLQLCEANVLITDWFRCHLPWHSLPPSDPRVKEIEEKIMRLRGLNYRDNLLILNKMASKLTVYYLRLKKIQLTQELEEVKNVKKM